LNVVGSGHTVPASPLDPVVVPVVNPVVAVVIVPAVVAPVVNPVVAVVVPAVVVPVVDPVVASEALSAPPPSDEPVLSDADEHAAIVPATVAAIRNVLVPRMVIPFSGSGSIRGGRQ